MAFGAWNAGITNGAFAQKLGLANRRNDLTNASESATQWVRCDTSQLCAVTDRVVLWPDLLDNP